MKKTFFLMATCVAFLCVGLFTSCSSDDETLLVNQGAEVLKPVDDNPYAVTIEEAQKQLEEILAKTDGNKTRSGAIRKIKNRFTTGGSTGATRSEDGEVHPVVHVFNFEDNGGFAIMAGDKRATPLLALTEGGELQQNMTTDNLGLISALLQAEAVYKAQIAQFESMATRGGTPNMVTVIDSVVIPVDGGLCPVEWSQDAPYNNACPIIGNKHAKAGSTAVALAQYMAYAKYPSMYGAVNFHWNDMIAGNNDSDIAALMYLLGLPINLDMQYGASYSYSATNNICNTLLNFGYMNGIVYDYDHEIVVNELTLSWPLLIVASQTCQVAVYNIFGVLLYYNVSYLSHTWLADGIKRMFATIYYYDGNDVTVTGPFESDYIHCNFGFGPNTYNGYYLSGFYNLPDQTNSLVEPGTGNRHIYVYDNNYVIDQQCVLIRR